MLEEGQTSRRVWLPEGGWIDWQSGASYEQSGWCDIPLQSLPVIILARKGSMIPVAKVAQHTAAIDWDSIEMRAFADANGHAEGWLQRDEHLKQ